MSSRRRVTDANREDVVRLTLSGIARDGDANDVLGDLSPLHAKHNTFPGELFLELGADALELARASRQAPHG